MSNKIIIHGAGGAGVNITGNLKQSLSELGDGFSGFEFHFIDTSDKNINTFKAEEPDLDFFKIDAVTFDGATIDGSGGERAANYPDIVKNVKKYLDAKKYENLVTGEFHCVLFSASGGSGSVIGPTILSELVKRDIPTFVIVVGDNSSTIMTRNTLNTIATLNNVAQNNDKPLSIMYFNNTLVDEADINDKMKVVDIAVFKSLLVMSAFTGDNNISIDSKDMINFIDQSNYTSFKVPAGLYSLETFANVIDIQKAFEHVTPMGSRTLTSNGISGDFPMKLYHNKSGEISHPQVVAKFKDMLPLHIVTIAGAFTEETKRLKDIVDTDYKKLNQLKNESLVGHGNADESGMVL